jgi:CubicO group peptidase (beta-lactamase class C family)
MSCPRSLFYLALTLAVACFGGVLCLSPPRAQTTSLDELLTPYLARYDLPAVAAAVLQDGKVVASGAVGVRRFGTTIPVTINNRFYLGSDTKAMTALLAAMLVEAGKLRWDTTQAQVFLELAPTMNPGLRRVTLVQFLSHTIGVPPR